MKYIEAESGYIAEAEDWVKDGYDLDADPLYPLFLCHPVALTDNAQRQALEWLREYAKGDIDLHADAWLSEIFERVSDRVSGEHEPDYELRASESKDGKPHLRSFADEDFIWKFRG